MGCFGGGFANFGSFESQGVLFVGLGGDSWEMDDKTIKKCMIMSAWSL